MKSLVLIIYLFQLLPANHAGSLSSVKHLISERDYNGAYEIANRAIESFAGNPDSTMLALSYHGAWLQMYHAQEYDQAEQTIDFLLNQLPKEYTKLYVSTLILKANILWEYRDFPGYHSYTQQAYLAAKNKGYDFGITLALNNLFHYHVYGDGDPEKLKFLMNEAQTFASLDHPLHRYRFKFMKAYYTAEYRSYNDGVAQFGALKAQALEQVNFTYYYNVERYRVKYLIKAQRYQEAETAIYTLLQSPEVINDNSRMVLLLNHLHELQVTENNYSDAQRTFSAILKHTKDLDFAAITAFSDARVREQTKNSESYSDPVLEYIIHNPAQVLLYSSFVGVMVLVFLVLLWERFKRTIMQGYKKSRSGKRFKNNEVFAKYYRDIDNA